MKSEINKLRDELTFLSGRLAILEGLALIEEDEKEKDEVFCPFCVKRIDTSGCAGGCICENWKLSFTEEESVITQEDFNTLSRMRQDFDAMTIPDCEERK